MARMVAHTSMITVCILRSTAADVLLGNRRRYPTVTTFSSSGQGLTAPALRQFLRLNGWKIVTVLYDELSLFPAAASLYLNSYRALQALLTETPGEFQMYYETYDSKNHPDYAAMLARVKAHSRSKTSVPDLIRIYDKADFNFNLLLWRNYFLNRDNQWMTEYNLSSTQKNCLRNPCIRSIRLKCISRNSVCFPSCIDLH